VLEHRSAHDLLSPSAFSFTIPAAFKTTKLYPAHYTLPPFDGTFRARHFTLHNNGHYVYGARNDIHQHFRRSPGCAHGVQGLLWHSVHLYIRHTDCRSLSGIRNLADAYHTQATPGYSISTSCRQNGFSKVVGRLRVTWYVRF
jgi:hypothetical protein